MWRLLEYLSFFLFTWSGKSSARVWLSTPLFYFHCFKPSQELRSRQCVYLQCNLQYIQLINIKIFSIIQEYLISVIFLVLWPLMYQFYFNFFELLYRVYSFHYKYLLNTCMNKEFTEIKNQESDRITRTRETITVRHFHFTFPVSFGQRSDA